MRVHAMFDLRNREDVPWPDFYAQSRDLWQELEHLGIDGVVFTQHHGMRDGYGAGLVPMLSAAATSTRRLRIGSAIVQLPLTDPVQLAEDLAVVDALSGGRLDVGLGAVGPGFDDEFAMFGRSPADRAGLFDEGIELLLRCWTEREPFDHAGVHWPDRKNIEVRPRPIRHPHPPVWVAAPGRGARERVARLGYGVGGRGGFFTGLTGEDVWRRWWRGWEEACTRHGRPVRGPGRPVTTWGTCYVTDDPERDWQRYKAGLLDVAASGGYEHLVGRPGTPDELPGLRKVLRTPEDAVGEARAVWGGGMAPDDLQLMVRRPGMTIESVVEFWRRFASTALPVLRSL